MALSEPPWEQALRAVLEGESIRGAARLFRVDPEALRRRLHGTVAIHGHRLASH
jgi:hypothetical protein